MDLQRCPFCCQEQPKMQSRRVGKYGVKHTKYYLCCHACWARGPLSITKEAAVFRWNTLALRPDD